MTVEATGAPPALAHLVAEHQAAVALTSGLHGDTPAARLRELLTHELAAGADFEEAWERSLPLATFRVRLRADDRAAWLAALAETREGWRRAYCGEPPTAGEDFEARLAA